MLFELATRDIGFAVDEPLETLGEALKLPPQYEHRRERARARADAADQPARASDGMTELVHAIRPAAGEPEGALVLLHGRGADEHDLAALPRPPRPRAAPGRRHARRPAALPPGGRHWYVVPRVGFPDPGTFRASYELRCSVDDPAAHRRAVGADRARRLLAGQRDVLRAGARRRAPVARRDPGA